MAPKKLRLPVALAFGRSSSYRNEIRGLARLLTKFKIDYNHLVKVCPRHKKTRLQAQQVAMVIAEDQEL